MRHVFIITYGRSGSTVLVNLLNAIDGYCIRGESAGVIGCLGTAINKLDVAHEKFANQGGGKSDPWFGISEIVPSDWAKSLAHSFESEILKPPAGTRVTGFKDIRYTTEHLDDEDFHATIGFLARSFDDARLIFNTRDWREVSRSGWWAARRSSEVRRTITASDERFREASRRLGDRALLVDYSDYNGRSNGLGSIAEWLGETVPMETLIKVSVQRLGHMKAQEPQSLARSLVRSITRA